MSMPHAVTAGADASGPSLLVPKAEWDATRRQLAELRQGHELLASLLQELSHSSAASIAALQVGGHRMSAGGCWCPETLQADWRYDGMQPRSG